MSRRKTRVTRMSRRKARYGTRKQNGGFLHYLNPLNWFGKKSEDPNAVAAAEAKAAPATNPTKPNGPAPPAAPDAPDAQVGGARKTRHRRRHHRK
jgi:hypothetical protein